MKINLQIMKQWLINNIGEFGLYLLFFFSPLYPLLLTVITLTSCDLFTGIIAAKKRGEIIHSRGLERTIIKCVLFCLAICLSHLMEIRFFDWLPMCNIVSGYICIVEFKSNIENISEYTGIDIWKQLISKLQKIKHEKHI